MKEVDSGFAERVYELVAQIPMGRVMTYGQIAAMCGSPRAARIVGGIAHFGPAFLHNTPDCPLAKRVAPLEFLTQPVVEPSGAPSTYSSYASVHSSGSPRAASKCEGCGGPEMPWQRVVMKDGGLATGFYGGVEGHKQALEAEGVKVDSKYKVEIIKLQWAP